MLEPANVIDSPALEAAVIRLTIPRDQIREQMGPAIGEVMSTVGAQGIGPAGPLFSRHLRMDPGVFDFEVGVPVSSSVKRTGRVFPSELPAARVAKTIYRGPYEQLGAAWQEFDEWIKESGLTSAGELWEVYLVGPESGSDTTNWRTELSRPLTS